MGEKARKRERERAWDITKKGASFSLKREREKKLRNTKAKEFKQYD